MDGQETTTLIDLGAQVSSISTKFCKDLALQIQPLGQLLKLEGTGDAAIPYLGFVEVNLQILGIRNYNEDVLLLEIPTTTYSEKVLIVVSSKIIDKALTLMTTGELAKVTTTWQQAHFGAVMSGLLQLSHASSDKNRVEEEAKCSSQEGDHMEVCRFCLNDVWGLVHTTQKVTILPFSTISVHGNSGVKGHCMWVHVLTEPMPGPQLLAAVVPMPSYGGLHGVLKGTNLPVKLECPCYGNSHKGHGWTGCSCQPSATGSPSNQDYWRVKAKTPKRVGLGGFRPPKSQRVVWIRAEAGQGAAAQMGTSVCTQWPGSG